MRCFFFQKIYIYIYKLSDLQPIGYFKKFSRLELSSWCFSVCFTIPTKTKTTPETNKTPEFRKFVPSDFEPIFFFSGEKFLGKLGGNSTNSSLPNELRRLFTNQELDSLPDASWGFFSLGVGDDDDDDDARSDVYCTSFFKGKTKMESFCFFERK